MDADLLVRDYLARLERAAEALPADRRAELIGEVRGHIDAALAEAGRSDEATVRNILERLGSPEEIVAGERGQPVPVGTGASGYATGPALPGSGWGAVEVTSLVLLGLAWPALFLPFGLILWLGLGIIGLVLAWASGVWSRRLKLIISIVVVALYVSLIVLFGTARGPDPATLNPSPIVSPFSLNVEPAELGSFAP